MMPEEYEKIAQLFEKVLESATAEITLDIKELTYLNSSGMKAVCMMILQAAEIKGLRMKILCSDYYTWQRETVPTFKDLMNDNDMEIVFERRCPQI